MLRRSSQPLLTKIDMTPMVGLISALVFAFMVMTPIYGHGVGVELPQIAPSWPSVSSQPETLMVGITRNGTTYFRGVKLDGGMTELEDRVAAYIQENPSIAHVIHLKADVATRFSEVNRAMTVCRKAGATDVRLIAEPRPEFLTW
jgi:biopolymer transport protein ExbD